MINIRLKYLYQTIQAQKFTYAELSDTASNLNDRIAEAYGPKGLGVCVVQGIPQYSQFRQALLPLAQKLASLPKEELKKLERPEAFHSKGWSCGVEQFQGKPDTSKGSFYNNPNYDHDFQLSEEELKQLGAGSILRIPNVWPQQIPQLESAYKNLGRLMIDVGAMLAYHLDKFIISQNRNYEMGKLYRFVRTGDQHTGRLLHYFNGPSENEWCGWHNDHSALTALTAPIHMLGDKIVDFSDKEGGLMARNRFTEIVKVGLDSESLAFQIGETAQIVSGGIVEATPHCVVRGPEAIKLNYNRNTFAVFMAPRFNERLNVPMGMDASQALNKKGYNVPSLLGRWKENIMFIDYSANTYKAYSY